MLLSSFGLSLPISGLKLPVAELALAVGVGVAMTVVASLAPAWRATRVAPVQALRDPAPEPARFSRRRLATGLCVTVAGVAALLAGIVRRGRHRRCRGWRGRLLHRRHRARRR